MASLRKHFELSNEEFFLETVRGNLEEFDRDFFAFSPRRCETRFERSAERTLPQEVASFVIAVVGDTPSSLC
jgi:hypothetical protein